jgi:hypothetical protein
VLPINCADRHELGYVDHDRIGMFDHRRREGANLADEVAGSVRRAADEAEG